MRENSGLVSNFSRVYNVEDIIAFKSSNCQIEGKSYLLLPKIVSLSMENNNRVWTNNTILEEYTSTFVLPVYKIFFSDQLALQFKPIVYSNQCLSGPPKSLYYRIVAARDPRGKDELCIQYFLYWTYQLCIFSSHTYDYEPILIYLKKDMQFPHLIVNGGLGRVDCNFHKNEIRPLEGERSSQTQRFSVSLSPAPYYPFGRAGKIVSTGCSKQYPLSSQSDLQFQGFHPMFGIRACSNVFSGAIDDLEGEIFDPTLERLTDRVLEEWYFKHSSNEDDMPFGHDISNPFSYPYIKYHAAKS